EGIRLGRAPFFRRVQGRSRHKDAARADVYERQHEELADAAQRQHPLREEIALPKGLGVDRQKLVPALLAPLSAWLEAMVAHDVPDELARELSACQLLHLAHHARVTEARFARDHHYEVAQGDERLPSRPARLSLAAVVVEPATEASRRHNGDQFSDRGA